MASDCKSLVPMSTRSNASFRWKNCDERSRLDRVNVKDLAVKNGIKALENILSTLKAHLHDNPTCQIRIDRIEALLAQRVRQTVNVGFLGSTGAGKTTLVNALLGIPGLVPTSNWRACTAVAVEIAINESEDKEGLFTAEITFVTIAEWREELESLFELFRSKPSIADSDDGTNNDEYWAEINRNFETIQLVYPHLKRLNDLAKTSAEKLLNHDNTRNILGTTKLIRKGNVRAFSSAIRSYIDSGEGRQKSMANWPIIKLVKCFVKSEILEHGITLVDLPGNFDRNSTRGATAARFQKDLSITCVVAEMKRAASEQNAQELLEKSTKRNLQLDGYFDGDHLAFIVTQTDSGMGLRESREYSHVYRNVGKDMRDPHQRYQRGLERMRELRKSNGSKISMESTKTAMLHAKSQMIKLCVDDRNKRASEAIKAEHQISLEQMDRDRSGAPLQVFCVAAKPFLNYCKPSRILTPGFLTKKETNIPDLRNWIISTTLEPREVANQAFLENVEALIAEMQPWISNTYNDIKMSAAQREEMEEMFEVSKKNLLTAFKELGEQTVHTIKQLVQSHIYERMPKCEKYGEKKSETTVRGWGKTLRWNTHKSINYHKGVWVDSKARKFNWNDELSHNFTDSLLKYWDRTFFEDMPSEASSYVEKAKELLTKFADTEADKSRFPQISNALEVLRHNILRGNSLLQLRTDDTFREISEAVRASHREAPKAIEEFLQPLFLELNSRSGTGHYQLNKESQIKFMRLRGLELHQEASKAIRTVIDKKLDELTADFDATYMSVIGQIETNIELFLDQNTSEGSRGTRRRGISLAKVKLQKALTVDLENLETAWKTNNFVEKEYDEDVIMTDGMDLENVQLEEIDDDDYSDCEN